MATEFKVTDYDFRIESNPGLLDINEGKSVSTLRYEGPYFYCNAKISCVIDDSKQWCVGFVQTCESIYLRHTYASGNYTQWEFPTPICDYSSWQGGDTFPYYTKNRPMISAQAPQVTPVTPVRPLTQAAQAAQAAWAARAARAAQTDHGMCIVQGPVKRESHHVVNLSMNDNLNSNVQCWDPVPDHQNNYNGNIPLTLTKIERKQQFTTYIVASPGDLERCRTGYKVLSKSIWRMHFTMDFDCSKAVGSRGTKKLERGHTVMYNTKDGSGLKLRQEVFVRKSANSEQKLVGYLPNGSVKKAQIPW